MRAGGGAGHYPGRASPHTPPALTPPPSPAPQARIDAEKARLATTRIAEGSPVALAAAEVSGQAVVRAPTLEELLRRPHVHYALLSRHGVGAPVITTAEAAAAAAAAAGGGAAGAQEQQQQDQQQHAPTAAEWQQQGEHGGEPEQQAPLAPLTSAEAEAVEIDIKYAGFIARQVRGWRRCWSGGSARFTVHASLSCCCGTGWSARACWR